MNRKTIIILALFLLIFSKIEAKSLKDSSKVFLEKRYSFGTNLTQLSTLLVPFPYLINETSRVKTDFFFRYYLSEKYCLTSNLGLAQFKKEFTSSYTFESKGVFTQLGIARHFNKGETISGLFGCKMGFSYANYFYDQKFSEDYWNEAYTVSIVKSKFKIYEELFMISRGQLIEKTNFGLFMELEGKLRIASPSFDRLENKEFIPGYGRYFDSFPLMPAVAINIGVDF